MAFHDLTIHADMPRLVLDDAYAKSKNIMVKKQNGLFILKYNKYGLNDKNINSLYGAFYLSFIDLILKKQ